MTACLACEHISIHCIDLITDASLAGLRFKLPLPASPLPGLFVYRRAAELSPKPDAASQRTYPATTQSTSIPVLPRCLPS
jgi:hypothetical protein